MGKIQSPEEIKFFAGLLLSDPSLLEKGKKSIELQFGPIDLESRMIPFSHTNYYNSEMGDHIYRLWVGFCGLFNPGNLADWKLRSNSVEDAWAEKRADKMPRRINIDPGYVSDAKVVLASTKNFSHRIYLDSGIYAEATMGYRKNGGWQFYDWTYPDYKEKAALDFFTLLRNRLLLERRACSV